MAQLGLELGADVTIGSSGAAKVEAALAKLPGAKGGTVDLRDETDVARFFAEQGAFDHLVVTAGDWRGGMSANTRTNDLAAARDGFEVRFWGALAAVKHATATLSASGSVTLTGGMLAHRPTKGLALATALAGGIEHLARGLAIDLAPIRVNAVCLGMILTEHTVQMLPPAALQGYVGQLPLPRGGSPAEAALAYAYLMLNTYATGQIVPVDGGGLLV